MNVSLLDRWRREMENLPPQGRVPEERAWRVTREYHVDEWGDFKRYLANVPVYRSIAQAHGCYMPLVALVREPSDFYVSLHKFITGTFASPVMAGKPYARSKVNVQAGYSLERYTSKYPNRQISWLMGRPNDPVTSDLPEARLRAFLKDHYDAIGTTDRMGDFVRRVCQLSGIPASLCPSHLSHSNSAPPSLCAKGLGLALQAPDTRVLAPDGPAKSMAEVRELCEDSAGLTRRLVTSGAMQAAVREHAPFDLILYALATEETIRWRESAPSELLLPYLGGDSQPVRYEVAVERGPVFSDRVERVGKPCQIHRHQVYEQKELHAQHIRRSDGEAEGFCVIREVTPTSLARAKRSR